MATGDVWRLSLIGSHSGTELAVITMHVLMKTSGATFAGAAAYLKTNLIDLLKTKQSSTFRWDEIRGLTVNTTPPRADLYNTGFPIACNIGTEEQAHQVALVVSTKTAFAGRSYRGRNYLPAIPEASITAGLFDNALVDAVQVYYDDLVAALGASGANVDYQWVVWSKRLQASNGITDTIVRNIPGVVRRRRIGVGV
jgi:hypothetical protein